MNLQELLEENKNYEELYKKAYSHKTKEADRDKIFNEMLKIRNKMWEFIFKKIPDQGYYDLQDICENAITNIFTDHCRTRLEALKFALKLKNSCDIYEEIADYINDDYTLECWSEKSLRVYQDCIETYFVYHGDELTNYKEIKNAVLIGAYCLIERVAVETINTLADIAEDLGIEEDEEE